MADDLFQVVKIGSTLFVMINKGMPETVECLFSRRCYHAISLFKLGKPFAKTVTIPVICTFQLRKYPRMLSAGSNTVCKFDKLEIIGEKRVQS